MKHFPIFLNPEGRKVIGADIRSWAADGRLPLFNFPVRDGDADCATLAYSALVPGVPTTPTTPTRVRKKTTRNPEAA
ncbi:MAG: hypothetical protein GY947_18190 [Rhodobacteraceae bacterium]|nr:hypothetical protein [Paracoccaceae bacterium]